MPAWAASGDIAPSRSPSARATFRMFPGWPQWPHCGPTGFGVGGATLLPYSRLGSGALRVGVAPLAPPKQHLYRETENTKLCTPPYLSIYFSLIT